MSTTEEATGRDGAPGGPRGGPRLGAAQIVGRLGWGVVDQAVSSLSNFALGLYVARTLGAAGLGAFTLAYVTYGVVLNAARGTATDPMLVRHSGVAPRQWRPAARAATATALLVGVAAGAVCAVAGLVLPGAVGAAFLALGVGLPGLMLQDSWRFAFFAAGRGGAALLNDVVWSLLLLAGLAVVHVAGHPDVRSSLLVFGGTATLAAAVGAAQARVVPRPSAVAGWLRDHRDLSSRYLVENVTSSSAAQIRSFVLGGVAGLAAVGFVRGAEILMGPFMVILMGVSQVAVPEAARVFRRSSRRLVPFCLTLGAVQGAAAALWGVALVLLLPLGPGPFLLKDLWGPTAPLVPVMTLNVVAACFLTAAMAGLRGMGVARRSLRVQLLFSAVYVVAGICGAVLGGAVGVCWGAVAANAVGATLAWRHLRAALTDHHRAPITAEQRQE